MNISIDGNPTETELDWILMLCINKYVTVNRDVDRLRNIKKILKIEGVGIATQNKYKLAKKIIDSLIEGNTVEYTIQNLMTNSNGSFTQYRDYIDSLYNEKDGYKVQDNALKSIQLRLMQHNLNLNNEVFKKYIEYVSEGRHYDTATDAWEAFEQVALKIYNTYKESKKDMIESDLTTLSADDDSEFQEQIKQQMILKYDVTNKIPTGFKVLDDILLGGYEKQSLYIYGGNPGSGKSTMLLNQIYNASLHNNYRSSNLKNKQKLFIYISVENSSMQTAQRLMCLHNNITTLDIREMLNQNINPLDKFYAKVKENNSKIVLYHKNSKSISPADIEVLIDNAIEKYRDEDVVLCGVYIDYLDQLKCDSESKEHRLNIEFNCQMLKNMAINLNIPIITATQLNRESFNIKSAKELSSKLIAESMGPVRIADFVALMAVIDDNKDNVFFKITKNRDGESGFTFDFPIDFSRSKFKNNAELVMENNINLANNSNDMLKSFSFDASSTF